MTPFEAYKMYLAIKMHFSGKYDYHKYKGQINSSKEKFESRNDKYFFHKLSRNYKPEDLEMFLVSNFMAEDNIWVGKLFEEVCINRYLETKGRQERIKYVFKEDVSKLKTFLDKDNQKFSYLFTVKGGQHPPLLKILLAHEIHVESFIILDEVLHIFKKWNDEIQDTVIWPEIYKKCSKYRPFLKVIELNRTEFKKILYENFLDN